MENREGVLKLGVALASSALHVAGKCPNKDCTKTANEGVDEFGIIMDFAEENEIAEPVMEAALDLLDLMVGREAMMTEIMPGIVRILAELQDQLMDDPEVRQHRSELLELIRSSPSAMHLADILEPK